MDAHDLIVKIKELALELGRTPTYKEFRSNTRGGEYQVTRLFGGKYSKLIEAAELDQNSTANNKKPNKEIFRTEINRHLDDYEPVKNISQTFPHMAIISDIHWPFEHKQTLDKFFKYNSDKKPDYVIIAGDAWDMYSHAKFPRTHNLFTPKDEEQRAKESNVEFWKEIKLANPNTRCVQMLGNHDVRPLKRTLEAVPTIEHWVKKYFEEELFKFDGVEVILDPREELMIDNIMIHHGYRSKLGEHRDYALYSAVVGHTHRPGTVWRKIRGSSLFELNCGLAGDPLAKGLSYTPQKIVDWVNSFGVIDELGPRNVIT